MIFRLSRFHVAKQIKGGIETLMSKKDQKLDCVPKNQS